MCVCVRREGEEREREKERGREGGRESACVCVSLLDEALYEVFGRDNEVSGCPYRVEFHSCRF